MGTSLNSIHVFSDEAPEMGTAAFASFSEGWQTCIHVPEMLGEAEKLARCISRQTPAPVLCFSVFDSESIILHGYRQGKAVVKYTDDELIANKRLFDIPALFGLPEGQKRRLSAILGCSDTELKIAMLEEYLGVCLLYVPELEAAPEELRRERGDTIYRRFQQEERLLVGKSAPYELKMVATYPGKLFYNYFSDHDRHTKPHRYLYGFDTCESISGDGNLRPVRFSGEALMDTHEDIWINTPKKYSDDPRFAIAFGTPCRVTFTQECPPPYRGKIMTLPSGFYPQEFTQEMNLLLVGNHRIYVVDPSLKVIAKLSVKGDYCDMVGDCILTTTGESFFAYYFNPKQAVYIYRLQRQER